MSATTRRVGFFILIIGFKVIDFFVFVFSFMPFQVGYPAHVHFFGNHPVAGLMNTEIEFLHPASCWCCAQALRDGSTDMQIKRHSNLRLLYANSFLNLLLRL
jgi:hypothetical protein